MVHHFNHRWGDYATRPAGSLDSELPRISDDILASPHYVVEPHYWVPSVEVDDRLPDDRDWLLGFRGITNTTNERSIIASVFPRSAVGNSMPLLLSDLAPTQSALLAASMSSFSFDYIARQKIGGTNLNFFIVQQLPVLAPTTYDQSTPWHARQTLHEWIKPRVLELTYTAEDLAHFARNLGYDGPPFKWDEERRSQLRAEVDACFFHLYGIGRDDVAYIMDTFPIVRRKDEAAYGEYRTARLILERYDEMARAIVSGVPYQGVLEEPSPMAAPAAEGQALPL